MLFLRTMGVLNDGKFSCNFLPENLSFGKFYSRTTSSSTIIHLACESHNRIRLCVENDSFPYTGTTAGTRGCSNLKWTKKLFSGVVSFYVCTWSVFEIFGRSKKNKESIWNTELEKLLRLIFFEIILDLTTSPKEGWLAIDWENSSTWSQPQK